MNTNINKNIKKHVTFYLSIGLFVYLIIGLFPAFAGEPSSTNYSLQEYSFGNGGTSNSTSGNYKLNAIAGEVEFGKPSSTSFGLGTGLTFLQISNLPPSPTFTNPANYYNKLQLQINAGGNPSDTLFAIEVTGTGTTYVQADDTLGTTPVWQTNTAWGVSGFTIIGLSPGVTYSASVAAKQGNFTQTAFGPSASVATTNPTFSYSISSNTITFPQLVPGTIQTSTTNITVTVSTNGNGGATIYGSDSNNGLLSSGASYTISAVSSDLSSSQEGYGLQDTSVTQTSGGPMEKLAPYNGTGNTVGLLTNTTKNSLFDSSGAAVTSGQGVFQLQAKAGTTTKAATDYSDILTIIASASF